MIQTDASLKKKQNIKSAYIIENVEITNYGFDNE